jgi:hypothetical protein
MLLTARHGIYILEPRVGEINRDLWASMLEGPLTVFLSVPVAAILVYVTRYSKRANTDAGETLLIAGEPTYGSTA